MHSQYNQSCKILEQFQQIVAVILCDTGIALLAYMDGITGSPTLKGVIYAALAAAVYAIFRVIICI